MNLLPLVERELRVAARRKGTYWTRFGAVLGVLVVWLFLVAGRKGERKGERGQPRV